MPAPSQSAQLLLHGISAPNLHKSVFSTRWKYFSFKPSILILQICIVHSSNVISAAYFLFLIYFNLFFIFNIWILKLLHQANILKMTVIRIKSKMNCVTFFRFCEIQCSGGPVYAYFNLCKNIFAIHKSNSEIFHMLIKQAALASP